MTSDLEPGWYEAIPAHEFGGDEHPIVYWNGTHWLLANEADDPFDADAFSATGKPIDGPAPSTGVR